MSLRKFYKELQNYKVGEHYDRRTYCYLVIDHQDIEHKFEVRYWKMTKYKIIITVVNWTMIAGSAILELDGYNYRKFKIVGEQI